MNDNETNAPEVSLDTWAVIELFGHSRIAGKVTNVSIAGCGFIRVQVPAREGCPAYTRDIAPKAVYAINPCDEAAAMAAQAFCSESPVIELCRHDIRREMMERMKTHDAHSRVALEDAEPEEEANAEDDDFNP